MPVHTVSESESVSPATEKEAFRALNPRQELQHVPPGTMSVLAIDGGLDDNRRSVRYSKHPQRPDVHNAQMARDVWYIRYVFKPSTSS